MYIIDRRGPGIGPKIVLYDGLDVSRRDYTEVRIFLALKLGDDQ